MSGLAPASTLMGFHMSAAVSLEDIGKTYGVTTVLDGVSLECEAGTVHALVGENGAGKSTLLKIMSGAVRPDRGRLLLAGEPVDLASLTPHRAQALGISVVHQEFSLITGMSVAENIYLGRERRTRLGIDRSRMRDDAAALLRRLGSRLDPDTRVEQISVADAQLVEIAKALSMNVRVVALDEPSAVLSGKELETLFEVVEGLRRDGVAVLYVSHRMDELFRLCDRYTVLKDGVVAGTGDIAETDHEQIVRMMVGRDVATAFPPPRSAPGEVRLETRNLYTPGFRDPISLSVRAGEVVGVAGLAGSGRSRLAKAIFGAVPASGEVFVDGKRVGPFKTPNAAIAAGIAYLPEDRKQAGLALTQSVSANASLLSLSRFRSRGVLSPKRELRRTRELIDKFAIRTKPPGRDPVGGLSGGNQQKVVLAKWMESEPGVVILDEPTRGIDVGSKEQIYTLIRELAADGMAFLVISSELIEVLGLSDRILVMSDGALVGELEAGATEEDVMRRITSTSHGSVMEGLA